MKNLWVDTGIYITWGAKIKDCKNSKVYDTKYNEKVKLLNKLSKTYGTNLLQKLIQRIKYQTLKDLRLCNYNTFKISKTPKNALLRKPKNAPLYIWCIPYPYNIQRNKTPSKILELKYLN